MIILDNAPRNQKLFHTKDTHCQAIKPHMKIILNGDNKWCWHDVSNTHTHTLIMVVTYGCVARRGTRRGMWFKRDSRKVGECHLEIKCYSFPYIDCNLILMQSVTNFLVNFPWTNKNPTYMTEKYLGHHGWQGLFRLCAEGSVVFCQISVRDVNKSNESIINLHKHKKKRKRRKKERKSTFPSAPYATDTDL